MNSIPALRAIAATGLLASAGLGIWLWQTNEGHRKAIAEMSDAHKRTVEDLQSAHAAALATEQEKNAKTIETLTADFEKKLDSQRQDQRKQMATAFKEFESIFDGNKRTIDYINALESKVQAGQAVSKAEVEKLAVIATGLGYLQKEYQKPMGEFKELEQYLSRQAANLPAKDSTTPTRFGFFKRMFSKEYRENEKQQLRDQGAREAFEAAQMKFSTVYASAQKQMASVSINADEYTKKIYALMDEKQQANKEDLSKFFDEARKALRTHQDVLDFQPAQEPESTPRP